MDNINVIYGAKWNNNSIINIINCDEDKNNIFTLIENDKYDQIKNMADDLNIIKCDLTKILRSHDCLNENADAIYDPQLKIILTKTTIHNLIKSLDDNSNNIKIGIYSAGMSEIDIVTMGFIYLKLLNYNVFPKIDLGVNNLKKTKSILNQINDMDIIITTAGMEAVLSTVLANITHKPIIAVPSNVSYGYGANGIVGLYSILMSDVPGIAIFNIGNIYGACTFAHKIGQYLLKRKEKKNNQEMTHKIRRTYTYIYISSI